jgi:hypothetical protein
MALSIDIADSERGSSRTRRLPGADDITIVNRFKQNSVSKPCSSFADFVMRHRRCRVSAAGISGMFAAGFVSAPGPEAACRRLRIRHLQSVEIGGQVVLPRMLEHAADLVREDTFQR